MKFSIIVPVYNVEKYIEKCLESINGQTYKNYEVIIVDDGSLDNSKKIIKKYIKDKKNFKYILKENGGLSDARNFGIQYVTGDYILFVDGDDYLNNELLNEINKKVKINCYDIIRFGLNVVDEDGNLIRKVNNIPDEGSDTNKTIERIVTHEFVEPAWLYAYNFNFWKNNNFLYAKGKIHEDFGLTPYILCKANKIAIINYSGYNYVQRNNSIMSQMEYQKLQKRTNDFKDFFLEHKNNIKPFSKKNKLILGYVAEAIYYKSRELKNNDLDEMITFIKQEKVINLIYPVNLKKFIQKIYLKLFLEKKLNKLSNEFHSKLGVKKI